MLSRYRLVLIIFAIFLDNGAFAQYSYTYARNEAAQIAASLDDNLLAAQVLLTGIDGKAALSPVMRSILERVPAGGIMLFKYNLDTSKDDVKTLCAEIADCVVSRAGIPPFAAVDHEGGLVHRFGAGVEKLPSAFSFWELAQKESWAATMAKAETFYRRSAGEIRDMGITLVFGPVAEILDDDNRLFLDTRSYGPNPVFTQYAASAFVKSFSAAGVACAVKHFPGNGAVDPHSGVSLLKANRSALDKMTKPFAGIIRSLSPAAIMISHVTVPALDQTSASLSRPVIEGWLRGELGFKGIVLADDYSMAAVAVSGLSPAAAAVAGLNAGVDMIMCWPGNIVAVHSAILEALESGRLSRERLREAAGRIIAEKIRCGLAAAYPAPGENQ